MATDLVTTDLTEKTTLVENDEMLIFDSEDIDSTTSLPMWKIAKMSAFINFQANIASRLYLETHIN
jgi:hypothetical protein